MPASIESTLGIYTKALAIQERRTEILARNLANGSTPGYKAQDLDFKIALKNAQRGQGDSGIKLKSTSAGHLGTLPFVSSTKDGLFYREPTQKSLDGNTVNTQIEQSAFSRNSIQYQATMTFLNGSIRGLMGAIKGE